MNTFNSRKWILFTSIGWVLGIALILILLIPLESLKINVGGQAIVGIGMSAGVGFMQWLLLKQKSPVRINWIWLSILGFSLPFILFDVLAYFIKISPEIYVPIATALSGVLAGWLQARFVLKCSAEDSRGWILFSFLGWFTATIITFLIFRFNMYIEKHVAIFIAFAALFIGGPLLGYITGLKMKILVDQKKQD